MSKMYFRKISEEDAKLIRQLGKNRLTLKQISEIFDVHPETILLWKNPRSKEKTYKRYRKWAKRNRGMLNVKHKIWRVKLKKEVLEHYGDGNPPKCLCCGETHIEFLSIDHIKKKRAGIKKDRTGWSFYMRLRRERYPKGYQVLCFNCNCAKGFYGVCPHEKERMGGKGNET